MLLAVWVGATLGCGSAADPSPSDAGPPLSASAICDELSTRLCDAAARCCADTIPNCLDTQLARCEETLGRAANDVNAGYDSQLARVAVNDAAERMERCDPELPLWIRDRSGFLNAFTGTRDPFDLCESGEANLVRAVSCRGEGSCQRTPSDDRCRPPLGSGEVCQSDFDCPLERFCQVECREARPADSPCFRSQMCSSGICRRGNCREAIAEEAYCFLDGFDFFESLDPPAP